MAQLGKSWAPGLLLLGGVLALVAGYGRVVTVGAETRQPSQTSVAGLTVYVSDFELRAVAPSPAQHRASAATTGANPADNTAADADIPSVQADLLTDAFAKT
ncbi:MAG TPA: hypothetical protein VF740_16140, partial [Candidatus Acidoferrum sp.]